MRSLRLALAAAVGFAGVAGTMAASGAGADQPPACTGRIDQAGNGWSALRPTFPAGDAKVQQAVALPYSPDRIYATNGTSVVVTGDAGCHWSPIVVPERGSSFDGLLPEPLNSLVPEPVKSLLRVPTTAHVASIAAPSSATASAYVYIGLNDESAVGTQPRIVYYDGQGWHQSQGLPRFGSIAQVSAVDNIPTSSFALIDPDGPLSEGGLYASSNGGQDFVQRNATVSSGTLRHLAADPVVNTIVYGLGRSGLVTSHDGGSTFGGAGHPADDMDSYDVTTGFGAERLVLGHSSRKAYERSEDAGLHFRTVPAPVPAKQVAMTPILDNVAVSDDKTLWLETNDDVKSAQDIRPRGDMPDQLQFTAPSSAGYALVGVRGDEILRRVFTLDNEVVKAPAGSPILLLPHASPHQFPSTLIPAQRRVRIPAGAHRDVSYRLLLPRTPSPVDIMFLVDTSSSTEKTIDGLKQDLATIVNDLADVGLDARFGVADFKDYSPTVADLGDGEIGDYAYRLDRVIGPADAALRRALSNLRAKGGGDPAESQLTALYQSTTGAGQRYPGKHRYIKHLEPGQDAHYRPGSLRLAVLATDDHFHDERTYLTPSWDRTVAALRAHQVHPIGLAMESLDDSNKSKGFRSYRVEQRLATDTGTFAPPGGVDCNGDLVPDVPAGAPFVCKVPAVVRHTVDVGPVQTPAEVEPVKLAAAISRAAETLPDLKPVTLGFRGRHRSIARVVSPTRPPQVNLKNDNSVPFTVRYSCPRLHHATRYPLHVDAAAGANVVATTGVTVSCEPLPKPAPHVVPPAAAVAVVAPAAPAPAPPAPGNPLPNPNPNPNPGLNANVGFASQQEEQRQLAFAGADAGAAPDPAPDELSMSRLRSASDPYAAPRDDGMPVPGWFVGTAALMLAGACGYAARSRFSAAGATVRR